MLLLPFLVGLIVSSNSRHGTCWSHGLSLTYDMAWLSYDFENFAGLLFEFAGPQQNTKFVTVANLDRHNMFIMFGGSSLAFCIRVVSPSS